MQPKYAKLQKVENKPIISESSNSMFWKKLQSSLLLALKEEGRLSGLQYQYALEVLHLSPDEMPEANN